MRYGGGTREARPNGDGYEKRFSPEGFYLYLVAHERKHYLLGGTGLRSLLDVYVYLKAEELDMRYVGAEVKKLGIGNFEEGNRLLATRLFGDGALTDADEGIFSYMVDSGTFGTLEHDVDNKIARHGRAGYLVRSAFPPLQIMKQRYPILGKVPVLLPVCWVARLASAVVTKPGRVAYGLRAHFRRRP
jgi:hypothetical protein